jgi:Gas vesicle synthesis protein GvpL/GvpF
MTEVHVFGVVSAKDGASAGARAIAHGDVAAIVSDVEPGRTAAAALLRAHSRILEEAARDVTVLPVRFGTVMVDDRAVVDDFLAPSHDALAATIAELAGKVQLAVKAFYEEEALMRGVVEGSAAIARLRERVQAVPEAAGYYDRIRLGEMVSAEVERARERDSAFVLGRLEPLAVAAANEPISTPDSAVNAAFLVERARIDEFSAAVAKLGKELEGRMRLRYVGPLPPYSFAGDATTAGAPAWA